MASNPFFLAMMGGRGLDDGSSDDDALTGAKRRIVALR
jgi:hypothetical protein